MKVFISGSISIKQLPKYAIEKIENVIEKGYFILVGDAKGTDSLVQKYLNQKDYKNVLVYFAGKRLRNNFGNWQTNQISYNSNKKGRDLYTLKDIEMANHADYGLMIWDGKSEGTLNNITMMQQRNKDFFVITDELVVDEKNVDLILMKKNKQKINERKQMELF
jgi:hypothetical protein